jgi:hypothetical protein
VPYGPHLELGSKASKEAERKRKNDAGVGPAAKRVKVSGLKAMALKTPVAPKRTGTASSKAGPSHAKSAPKASATPRASVPPRAGAPPKTTMQKSAGAPAASKAVVLKISSG